MLSAKHGSTRNHFDVFGMTQSGIQPGTSRLHGPRCWWEKISVFMCHRRTRTVNHSLNTVIPKIVYIVGSTILPKLETKKVYFNQLCETFIQGFRDKMPHLTEGLLSEIRNHSVTDEISCRRHRFQNAWRMFVAEDNCQQTSRFKYHSVCCIMMGS